MIPKIIHYCWFGGGQYPSFVRKCMASWHRYCPDYEIKLWNETNYDVSKSTYMYEAYQAKKWAFVSDVARLDIIYRCGGIYLDTDVELIKSIDDLLTRNCFVSSDGMGINTGIGFGSEANHLVIKEMLDQYAEKHFMTNTVPDLTPCTYYNTQPFLKAGYDIKCNQVIQLSGVTIFPSEYFSPIKGKMSELHITPNTYSIHWSSLSWETGLTRLKAKLRIKIGVKNVNKIKKIINFLRKKI